MATRIVSTQDAGLQLTVSELVKDPLLVPQRILDITSYGFVAEEILRSAGSPAGGSVVYWESTPLFPENDQEPVAEFAEIPLALTDLGTPKPAQARKRALGVAISQEMINRNQIDLVNTQLNQVKNALIKGFDNAMMTAARAAPILTRAATAAWSTGTAAVPVIRKDVALAQQQITDQLLGFEADTLLIHPTSRTVFLSSPEFTAPYTGDIAHLSPLVTGQLPAQVNGLDIFVSYQQTSGVASVLQRKVAGGYADERPLQATELYEDRPTETWRSDALRGSALFIDQPKAWVDITGV